MLYAQKQLLIFDDIALTGVTGQTDFIRSAGLRLASGFIQNRFETSLAADMKRLSQELTKAMNGSLSEDFQLTGSGEVFLADISLTDRADTMTAIFKASGNLSVIGFNPFK